MTKQRSTVQPSTTRQLAIRRACTRARVLAIVIMAAAVLLGAGATSSALAQTANCSFLEIEASNKEGGIDGKLKPLAKKLKKPPLSSWKSYKLVAKHDKSLARMKPEDIRLTLGGKLSALLRRQGNSQGQKTRFEVSITIDNKSGKRAVDSTINVSSGDYLIFAFDVTSERGNLLAFTCK
ncbi:MAG: hypothetical protein MJE77_24080 [Proteobacteria bacterium]|nr:hypothetical protein [Pseudomonadota bacterium]